MNMWSANEYLDELYDEAVATHQSNYDEKWKNALRDNFKKLLGNFEDVKSPFQAREIERVDMGSYERLRIEINTLRPSLKMPIYVLIPKIKRSEEHTSELQSRFDLV